ncbi:MAG: hypothetical protein D6773_02525 [Alphaproteobacteria bacterium]|nr:MAG: hypothetical protein D6773_02525 [Alphaproteobacteria bacterium]
MPIEVVTKSDLEAVLQRIEEMKASILQRMESLGSPTSAAGNHRLLSLAEAAKLLGVHKSHLWRLLQRGEGPQPVYIDSKPRYWEHELRAWVDSCPRDHLAYQQQRLAARDA